MQQYTQSMKARMIKRLTGPNAMSATALSQETGIAQATLSRWLARAGTVGGVSTKKRKRTQSPSKRTQDWTLLDKLAVVIEAAELPQEELGAFLRRKGLHREQLEQWREVAARAFEESSGRRKRGRRGPTPEQKRIRELERQLRRKEKALAEAAALLILKKKFETVFGDEEDNTDPKSEG